LEGTVGPSDTRQAQCTNYQSQSQSDSIQLASCPHHRQPGLVPPEWSKISTVLRDCYQPVSLWANCEHRQHNEPVNGVRLVWL